MQEGLAAAQKLLLASRAQHSAEIAALKQQLAAAQQSSQQSAQQGATASAELDEAKKVSSFQGVAQMTSLCLVGFSQMQSQLASKSYQSTSGRSFKCSAAQQLSMPCHAWSLICGLCTQGNCCALLPIGAPTHRYSHGCSCPRPDKTYRACRLCCTGMPAAE